MMQLEFHQLELRYAGLRIATARGNRLIAQLADAGQQSPVVVIEGEGTNRYVLIDGYRRVEALRQLSHDTVDAVVLCLPEAEALLWHHRHETGRRRSALEEGWLIGELCDTHGLSAAEVATRLARSPSWVSRRLALVQALPQTVHQLIREGRLCAYAASKYLVPLARANKSDCETLAENLAGHRVSVRQMHKLYVAWRQNDREGRARLVQHPTLYLQASAEAEEPPHTRSADDELLSDLHTTEAILRRLGRRLRSHQRDRDIGRAVHDAWSAVQHAFDALFEYLRV